MPTTGRASSFRNDSLHEIFNHPLGMGPWGFAHATNWVSHNTFLGTTFNHGWIGGAAYLTLIVLTLLIGFRTLWMRTPWQPFLIATYVSFLAMVFEGVWGDTDHWRHFYILLGCVWGLVAATQKAVWRSWQERPRRHSLLRLACHQVGRSLEHPAMNAQHPSRPRFIVFLGTAHDNGGTSILASNLAAAMRKHGPPRRRMVSVQFRRRSAARRAGLLSGPSARHLRCSRCSGASSPRCAGNSVDVLLGLQPLSNLLVGIGRTDRRRPQSRIGLSRPVLVGEPDADETRHARRLARLLYADGRVQQQRRRDFQGAAARPMQPSRSSSTARTFRGLIRALKRAPRSACRRTASSSARSAA